MPNFKVIPKQGHYKSYQSGKYTRFKSYILPTTTTITDPNDNRKKYIHLVTLAVVTETYATILTVITVEFFYRTVATMTIKFRNRYWKSNRNSNKSSNRDNNNSNNNRNRNNTKKNINIKNSKKNQTSYQNISLSFFWSGLCDFIAC